MKTKRILYFVLAALMMLFSIGIPLTIHWFTKGWNVFWFLPLQVIFGWFGGRLFAHAVFMKDDS